MNECKHIIGMIHDYDNTRLATVSELKEHITSNEEWYSIPHLQHTGRPYTLNDYCDMRKIVDMTRFKHCPLCGAKIDWKAIKENSNEN